MPDKDFDTVTNFAEEHFVGCLSNDLRVNEALSVVFQWERDIRDFELTDEQKLRANEVLDGFDVQLQRRHELVPNLVTTVRA